MLVSEFQTAGTTYIMKNIVYILVLSLYWYILR